MANFVSDTTWNTAQTKSSILCNNYHTVWWKFNDMEEACVP